MYTDFIDILKDKLRYAFVYHFCTVLQLSYVQNWTVSMIIDRAEGNEFVDLLDTLWYVYTNEADADFETFCRIFKSKGVRNWNWLSYDVPAFELFLNSKYSLLLIQQVLIKLYAVIDKNKSGQVSVDQLMTFFTECTAKGWVFCACRHISWSSLNSYFKKITTNISGSVITQRDSWRVRARTSRCTISIRRQRRQPATRIWGF